jgi:hypothetical protein
MKNSMVVLELLAFTADFFVQSSARGPMRCSEGSDETAGIYRPEAQGRMR